jgi:hypothetical protein
MAVTSPQNGNLKVPACFLKATQMYAVRKLKKKRDKWLQATGSILSLKNRLY